MGIKAVRASSKVAGKKALMASATGILAVSE